MANTVKRILSRDDMLAHYLTLSNDVNTLFGWGEGDFDAQYDETLLSMGLDQIDAETDQLILRKAARISYWRKVAAATVGKVDTDADGASVTASQMHKQALEMLALDGVYTKPPSGSGGSNNPVDPISGSTVKAKKGADAVVTFRSPYRRRY